MTTAIESFLKCVTDETKNMAEVLFWFTAISEQERLSLLDRFDLCPINSDGHINTRILLLLAPIYPYQVANHPLFVLHTLVEPNDDFIDVICEIVPRTNDKELFQKIITNFGQQSNLVRQGFARHKEATADLLRRIWELPNNEWQVRSSLASNPKTPREILSFLGNQDTEPDFEVRQNVAENPSTPEDVLIRLSSPDTEIMSDVRERVAKNKNTPIQTLRKMTDKDAEYTERVRTEAMNTLEILSGNLYKIEILQFMARDAETPYSWRVWMAKHPEHEVREALLSSPSLFASENGKLLTELALRLSLEFPVEVLHHASFVLHAVIEQDKEMADIIIPLLPYLTEEMFYTLYSIYAKASESFRTAVAQVHNTPEAIFAILGDQSKEPISSIRQYVAANTHAPKNVLQILGNEATESSTCVRQAVAENPSTPKDVFRTLGNQATESDWKVRREVARNRNTPWNTLRTLGNQATESDVDVRKGVAENPSTPVDVLRTLANSTTESSGSVREAAHKALWERGLT